MVEKKRKYTWIRRILIFLLICFIILQFVRPDTNDGEASGPNDISHVVKVPDGVMNTLVVACYDCHSNHTDYPWYAYINPAGFWLADHIKDGKRHLNFTEFAQYDAKRKRKKIHEIAEVVEDDEMPLSSYTLIHTDAELSAEQKQMIINWATEAEKEIK